MPCCIVARNRSYKITIYKITIYQLTSSNVILLLNEYPLCNVVCTLYSRVETSNIILFRGSTHCTHSASAALAIRCCIKNSHSTNFLITSHYHVRSSFRGTLFLQTLWGSRSSQKSTSANILLNHTNIPFQTAIHEIFIMQNLEHIQYNSCGSAYYSSDLHVVVIGTHQWPIICKLMTQTKTVKSSQLCTTTSICTPPCQDHWTGQVVT